MVSLWPWKHDSNSPASFEKTLATLSGKINTTTGDLEGRRQNLRRFKGLWTLFSVLLYLIYLVIAALVLGWKSWGTTEYSVAAGGPVVIYLVRRVIRTFYEFLISSSQDHLEGLQKERDRTVAKLKEATKYDTTLQLLEKYGGSAAKPKPVSSHNRKSSKEKPGQGPKTGRVSFVPPPTANIPRPPSSATGTPGRSAPFSPPPNPPHTAGPLTSEWKPPDVANEPNAEFAPNAFNAPQPQYTDGGGSGWYDRLMDVLLGEDETNPKNRIVLICQNCRLVNGQAPPGVKTLQQVGEWRCTGCGTMNGQDLLIDSLASAASESPGAKDGLGTETAAKLNVAGAEIKDQDDNESDITQYSEDDRQQHGTADGSASAPQTMAASEGAEIAPAHSTRARKKQNAKG